MNKEKIIENLVIIEALTKRLCSLKRYELLPKNYLSLKNELGTNRRSRETQKPPYRKY